MRLDQLVLCDSLELDYCIPMLKGEPDYVCSIRTKIVMDSTNDSD